jgi:hypothetical protein
MVIPGRYKQSGIRSRQGFHVFQRNDVPATDLCLENNAGNKRQNAGTNSKGSGHKIMIACG